MINLYICPTLGFYVGYSIDWAAPGDMAKVADFYSQLQLPCLFTNSLQDKIIKSQFYYTYIVLLIETRLVWRLPDGIYYYWSLFT